MRGTRVASALAMAALAFGAAGAPAVAQDEPSDLWQAYTEVLSVLSVIAIGAVLWVSRRLGSRLWAIGLGALLAGVAGNLTDRVFREPGFLEGHVVDYLRLPHWPIFNIADICINAAAAIIVIQALRGIGVDGRRLSKAGE